MNFTKNSIHFELHLSLAGLPSSVSGKNFLAALNFQLLTAEKISVDNASFFALPAEYHATVILIHMNHHMITDGIALRHLCDWATYVSSESFDESKLTALLEPLGILTLARVYTKACVDFLSVSNGKALAFCCDVKPEYAKYIINDIFEKGHFGYKNNSKRGALVEKQFTVSPNGKPHGIKGIFSYFAQSWQPSVKHPSLTLIAPAAVFFRHLLRVVTGRSEPFNPVAFSRKARRQKKFYRSIGLFDSTDK